MAVAKKDLSYFMRKKKLEIVKFTGPETFVDEEGNPIEFEMRVLTMEEQRKINDMYTTSKPAKDGKGNYIIQNGKLVHEEHKDSAKASRHMMAEALVYPDLKNEELMKFYNCPDVAEMPYKVFSTPEEFNYVNQKMLEIFGYAEKEEDDDTEDAKN